jgi:hypothetical protein
VGRRRQEGLGHEGAGEANDDAHGSVAPRVVREGVGRGALRVGRPRAEAGEPDREKSVRQNARV